MPVVTHLSRFWRVATVLALSLGLALGAMPPAASSTEQELEDARRQLEQAQQERARAEAELAEAAAGRAQALGNVQEAIEAYERVNGEYQDLVYRTGLLRSRIESYEIEVARLRDSVRTRAVQAYMFGRQRDEVGLFVSSEEIQNAIIAREILAQAIVAEAGTMDALEAATAEMDRLRDELAVDSERVNDLRIEAEAIAERMYELLADAESEVAAAGGVVGAAQQQEAAARGDVLQLEGELAAQRAAEEAARLQAQAIARALQTPAAQGVSEEVTPGFLCPVAGPSAFADTWGAPRSGGRTHKGVDMMGPRGTPLVAVGSGTVSLSYGVLGGIIVWLHADHGVSYFYAHLDGYAPGLANGQWVERGQLLGYMGDTGNPAPGAYHLHFGIYPGGSSAVNPYQTVARHCP